MTEEQDDFKQRAFQLLALAKEQQEESAGALRALQAIIPHLSQAASDAARDAVRLEMGNAPSMALQALQSGISPALGRLEALSERAERASASLGWKWVAIAMASAMALLAAIWLATWWQRQELAAISAEVAELRSSAAELERLGARIKFNKCDGKECVRVTKSGYTDKDGNSYAVLDLSSP